MAAVDSFSSEYPSRDKFLPCIKRVLDLDNNGTITRDEITQAFPDSITLPDDLMAWCDTNGDGVLDMTDWDATNACLSNGNMMVRSLLKQRCEQI